MVDDGMKKKAEPNAGAAKERRDFLKKAGLTAAAAPAATMLLSAKAKRAQAIQVSGLGGDDDPDDDL